MHAVSLVVQVVGATAVCWLIASTELTIFERLVEG